MLCLFCQNATINGPKIYHHAAKSYAISIRNKRGKRKDTSSIHKCAKYERKKKRHGIYFKPYNIKYRLKSFKFTTFNNQSNKIKKEAW